MTKRFFLTAALLALLAGCNIFTPLFVTDEIERQAEEEEAKESD